MANITSELALPEKNLKDDDVIIISQILRLPTTVLRKLVLRGNAIGDIGALSLSSSLENNMVLTKLILSKNVISDRGCIGIAEMLKVNTSLTYLALDRNQIGNEGIIAIGRALQIDNITLRFLWLNDNFNVTDIGVSIFIETFRQNTALFSVNLKNNNISENIKLAILQEIEASNISRKVTF